MLCFSFFLIPDSKQLSSGSVASDIIDQNVPTTPVDTSRPHAASVGGLRPRASHVSDHLPSPTGSPATSPPRSRSRSPGRRWVWLNYNIKRFAYGSLKK